MLSHLWSSKSSTKTLGRAVRSGRRGRRVAGHVRRLESLEHRYALAAQLTTTPITWEVLGLDSNKPLVAGPNEYLIGARITNTGTEAITGVTAAMTTGNTVKLNALNPRRSSRPTAPPRRPPTPSLPARASTSTSASRSPATPRPTPPPGVTTSRRQERRRVEPFPTTSTAPTSSTSRSSFRRTATRRPASRSPRAEWLSRQRNGATSSLSRTPRNRSRAAAIR